MKRDSNVETWRGAAVLLVMLYHFQVLSQKTIPNALLRSVLCMGGEIGVTMFFVLSGFGTWLLLENQWIDTNSKTSFLQFISGRLKKLAPQYYICIFVLLLYSQSAVFLSPEHLPNIISHILFIHALVPSWHGAINGVLWTMSIIMQFYIIVYWLHRFIRCKLNKYTSYTILLLLSICSIAIKGMLYHVILPGSIYNNPSYYFIFGRQIYTAFDNFAIGIIVAIAVKREYKTVKPVFFICLQILSLGLLIAWAYKGYVSGIYNDTKLSYCWHSVCALICGIIVLSAHYLPEYPEYIRKPLTWFAIYSYGIYLWHLEATRNIVLYNTWINNLGYVPFAFILSVLCICMGWLSVQFGRSLNGLHKKR